MKKRNIFLVFLISFLLISTIFAQTSITKDMIPYTITESGQYSFINDVDCSTVVIIVNASNVIIDGLDHTISGIGCININDQTNVKIRNFTFNGYGDGGAININRGSDNEIHDNIFVAGDEFDASAAINLFNTTNNSIFSNEVQKSVLGMLCHDSNTNSVYLNTFNNCKFAVVLGVSDDNVFFSNTGEGNIVGFVVDETNSNNSGHSNTVSGADGDMIDGSNPIENNVANVTNSTNPEKFTLQNYPNPFNPTTTIKYNIPKASHVTLTVYNLVGQVVTLVNSKYQPAGIHTVQFDASNLPSGVYFYKLNTNTETMRKKMLLVK